MRQKLREIKEKLTKEFLIFTSIYICIFSTYYVVTSYLYVLYKDSYWSFVVFYGAYALGSLFSPLFLLLPKKLLFLFCTIAFTLFTGLCASGIFGLLLTCSALAGLANSIIWLLQGTFLASSYMSLFYSLYNLNVIIGNVLCLIVLLTGLSVQYMFLCLLPLNLLAVILSFFIKETKENQENITEQNNEKTKEVDKENIFKIISNTIISTIREIKNIYFIIPCFIYQAIGLNITYQILPRIFYNNEVISQYENILLAIIYIIYGIFAIIGSLVSGKIYFKNWKYLCYMFVVIETMCLGAMIAMWILKVKAEYYLIIGAARGWNDYSLNSLINISLADDTDKSRVTYRFALYRLFYATGYLTYSIILGYINYTISLGIAIAFSVICIASYCLYNKLQMNGEN